MKRTLTIRYATLALIAAGCFALSPTGQAVSPTPDGGYPGGNTAEGQNALFSLTTGGFNTALGYFSLRSNTTSNFNTAVGAGALFVNTADENTAIGAGALLSNSTGSVNTAIGVDALVSNTACCSTAIGGFALAHNTTGEGNTALGLNAGNGVTTANNVICIGPNVNGANVDNSCYIGNIFAASIDPSTATGVDVDNRGKLGTVLSAQRFKRDIKAMDKASEAILSLKPVTFHYQNDAKSTPCFGLVAEDVEKVNPKLVVRGKNGELLSVRYDAVNAMLLNEFLKEHRQVQEEKATIARLNQDFQSRLSEQQKQIEMLSASLQKVRAQIEVSKTAAKVVSNHP